MTLRTGAFVGTVAFGLVALAPAGRACESDDVQASTYRTNSSACPTVSDIKTMPFRREIGVDAAYDRFRFSADCDDVLIKALTSLRPMPDPNCPSYGGFVEADAALFVLAEKHGIEIPDLMPESERANWKAQGVYAYFAYVEEPKRRARANGLLLALMSKRNNKSN